MAVFNLARYGLSKYGKPITSTYYNSEIEVVSRDYNSLLVTWSAVTPDPLDTTPTHWKLLKTYGGTPNHVSDGTFLDGDVIGSFRISYSDTSFEAVNTQEVFYSLWVYNPTNGWIFCGSAGTFVVLSTDTLTKFISWIPRAWVTSPGEVTGGVDPTNDFINVISAFAFEYDSLRTEIDGLGKFSNSSTASSVLLKQQVLDLGFNYEPALGDLYHRTMYKSGHLINANKGTARGIKQYVTSITHLDSDVKIGHNLLLDYNDSSFEEGVGRWVASSGTFSSGLFANSLSEIGVAITAPTSQVLHDTIFPPRALGYGKLNTTATTPVVLTLPGGSNSVVTTGIPVTVGTRYIFSGWIKRVINNVNISATISWYNSVGGLLSTTAAGTTVTATTSWKEFTTLSDSMRNGQVAPERSCYAKINLTITPSSATSEYIALDMFQFSGASLSLEYQDARLVEISIEGGQENYALNSDFGSGTGFWKPINGSLIQNALAPSTAIVFGAAVAQLTSTTTATTAISSEWIYVDSGESHEFSAQVSGPVGRTAIARIEFTSGETLTDQDLILEDVNGQYYPTNPFYVNSAPVTLTATAQKISVSAIVPPYTRDSGRKVAKVSVYITDNVASDVYYFDAMSLGNTIATSDFFNGSGAVLPVDPINEPFYNPLDCFWETKTRYNYVKNPGLEVTTGWTGTGITITSEVPSGYSSLYGSLSGKAAYTTTGSMAITVDLPFTAVGGEDLVVSAYVRNAYTDYTIGTNIGGVAPTSSIFKVADAYKAQWVRIHNVRQLQAGETSFVLTISVSNPGGSSSYFHLDGVQAELGRVPTKFIEPIDTSVVTTLVNPGNPSASMYGTREPSTGGGKSSYVSNYYIKYSRLFSSLPLVLPSGCSWAIRPGKNTVEYTDLAESLIPSSSFERDFGTWVTNTSILTRVIYGGLLSGDKISHGASYGLVTTTRDGTGAFTFGLTTDKIYIEPSSGYYSSIAIRPAN